LACRPTPETGDALCAHEAGRQANPATTQDVNERFKK
jgi:hypothetical protein